MLCSRRTRAALVSLSATVALAVAGLAVASSVVTGFAAEDDPVKRLKSKDVDDRLEVVEYLRVNGGEDVITLLVDCLDDRDWEVREAAAHALAEQGDAESASDLADVAINGPVRRVRMAAVDAALRHAPAESADAWRKRIAGKDNIGIAAAEALARMAQTGADWPSDAVDAQREGLERGLGSKEAPVRRAAARGLAAFAPAATATKLQKLLYDEDIAVAAAAISGLRARPDATHLAPLLVGLGREDLPDVLERRIHAAIHDVIAIAGSGDAAATAAAPVATALARAGAGAEAARLARAIGLLGETHTRPPEGDEKEPVALPGLVPAAWAVSRLGPALDHEDVSARAAAVHALGLIGTAEALARAGASAKADPSPRVRMHAVRAVALRRPAPAEATVRLAADRLEYDEDARVREAAAIALGARGADGGVATLTKALKDSDEWVRVCAAVSLGKTRSPDAFAPLQGLRAGAKDWRLRGAAVVGLGRLQRGDAVPELVDSLTDKTPAISQTAFEFLRRLTTEVTTAKRSDWEKWWETAGADYVFLDREEEARKAQKFGYAPDFAGVYEGLDVIVLQSRGDSIEDLLERLGIEHRITRQAAVPEAGLHPFGVFVSNCTGEVTDDDIEQLQWFVRVGGYLFCSCWALHHTAEKVYPGVVRKLPTTQTVLDNVEAEPCPTDSFYLDGVFDGITRPIYVLYGSHLIEVLDPERAEVLIDSPDCATRWGGGNLAAWFDAGHGVILDSANHFDLQGLERAEGLKSADDRRAYAMDHMGLDYAEVRELDKLKVWKSQSKAHKAARDLSAFRFITNFVREKRRTDP